MVERKTDTGFAQVKNMIAKAQQLMFDINISPKAWVLPNRVKFTNWIDTTFQYDAISFNNSAIKTIKSKNKDSTQEDACNTKAESVDLFSHQKFIKDYIQYDSPYRGLLVYHGLGTGKCHAKDTPILMYNGSIKMVQDIQVGEKIMGDDSTPRKILNLTRGNADLYEIVPTNGEKHVVNEDHILCLKLSSMGVEKTKAKVPTYVTRTLDKQNQKLQIRHFETKELAQNFLQSLREEDNIIEISVKDYLPKSSKFKSNLKLYRKAVEFPFKPVDFDPYILGVWLGDGVQREPVITNQDATVLSYLRETVPLYGCTLNYQNNYAYRISSCTSCKNKTGKNTFLNALNKYKMRNNKHIPDILKCNSRDVRMQVLAGIVDTDGSLDNNCYEISQVNERLMDDIIYLARSLGFSAYKKIKVGSCLLKNGEKFTGTYYRTIISGEGIHEIPVKITRKKAQPRKQKKDVLVTGFKINKISKGDYYGFTVDKNHRYLLGDFTVTHNSCSAVAAAEIMLKNMNVTVMLPASLKPNFVDEIKKCGNMFFKLRQEWSFLPLKRFTGHTSDVAKLMSLDAKYITKQGGIWLPTGNKTSNFASLGEEAQSQIILQIDNMVKNRFTFISYNGLSRKKIEEMTEGGRNPFDNQCIIIDEVHNFVSRIVNARQIGQVMYKLIMTAKNCKLVCLSGTPIINYPHEIAYLINLITGYRYSYELKASKNSDFKIETITNVLEHNPYVDDFTIDENARKISIILVPVGFAITKDKLVARAPSGKALDHSEMLDTIITALKKIDTDTSKPTKAGITMDEALPEDQERFNSMFVNFSNNTINNPNLFMKRVLGTVSFYSTYSPELYPEVKKTDVPIPMNSFQFPIYEQARAKEIRKESLSKNKSSSSSSDNPFASSGQVYRFYSRAICNFVFPEEIKRPFPSKMSFTKNELDVLEDDEKEQDAANAAVDDLMDTYNSKTSSSKSQEKDAYIAELNIALDELSKDMYSKQSYLNENNIEKYSPKFKQIFSHVKALHGNALVYSQFKKIEGLGILGLVMRANGYAEFKVKKLATGEWDIDIAKEDYKKPKFTMFTGNNEESKILLKIFNSDFETLPETIKTKLPLLVAAKGKRDPNTNKELNNLHGELIKVIMITQSGAEGISLKNVRQVHIMEPYWNNVRMDQVMGRAVRTCSHVSLPPEERNVEVFTYYTVFTPELLEKSFTLKTKDKGFTTDEYIYRIAQRKGAIINAILNLLKRASVDCGINAKKHKNMKCFNFPGNIGQHMLSFNNNIRDDMLDEQYTSDIVDTEWKGKVIKTKIGNFLINESNNFVYDYDLYIDGGKLIKIGELKKDSTGKMSIVKV